MDFYYGYANSDRVIVSQEMVWSVQGEYGHTGYQIHVLLLFSTPGYGQ